MYRDWGSCLRMSRYQGEKRKLTCSTVYRRGTGTTNMTGEKHGVHARIIFSLALYPREQLIATVIITKIHHELPSSQTSHRILYQCTPLDAPSPTEGCVLTITEDSAVTHRALGVAHEALLDLAQHRCSLLLPKAARATIEDLEIEKRGLRCHAA